MFPARDSTRGKVQGAGRSVSGESKGENTAGLSPTDLVSRVEAAGKIETDWIANIFRAAWANQK